MTARGVAAAAEYEARAAAISAFLSGLERAMVASIGPTTSEELSRQRIRVDLEPSHPKMGFLVREAAERAAEFIRRKPEESASA